MPHWDSGALLYWPGHFGTRPIRCWSTATAPDRPSVSLPDKCIDVDPLPVTCNSRLISPRRSLPTSASVRLAGLSAGGRPRRLSRGLTQHQCIVRQNESAYGNWRLSRGKAKTETVKVHGKIEYQ